MAAHILSIVPVRHRKPTPEPVALGVPQDLPARLHFWRGASAKRYVHTVYSLIECPPLPRTMYLLVRRDKGGQRKVLHIGRGQSDGSFRNDISADVLASALLGAGEGMMRDRMIGQRVGSSVVYEDEAITRIFEAIVNGLAAKP